jgi:glycerol uptake facilitator-like aquaporin
MATEQATSKSAKILYAPVGLVSSVAGGVIAGQVFKQVWKHATPTDTSDAPKPLESEYSWGQVLAAAAAQGAVFATVKAVIQRGGARAFQRWTGEWPGD